MAINIKGKTVYGPNVVTDGLVLYLDAANTRSYPGNGTAWYDLSGNGNNGTMIGDVPLINDVVQCFDFATATGTSASNSTLGFSLKKAVNTSTGNYTIDCWIKTNQSMSQHTLLSNAGGGNGFRFGPGKNGVYVLCGPTYKEGVILWISTYNTNLWHNVVSIFDRDGSLSSGTPKIYTYLDGIYQNYMQLSTQTAQTTELAGIVRNPCCQIWTGKLASLKIYKKSLLETDIQQNFNTLKRRFEL